MDRGAVDAPFAQPDPDAGRQHNIDEANLMEFSEHLLRLVAQPGLPCKTGQVRQPGLVCRALCGLDRYLVAEAFQPLHRVARYSVLPFVVAVAQYVAGDLEDAAPHRDGSLLASTPCGDPSAGSAKVGALSPPRCLTHFHEVRRRVSLPLRVRALRCFPALSLLPGHMPVQDVRWSALGKQVTSGPLARMTSAPR
jgi:hypothetical protein